MITREKMQELAALLRRLADALAADEPVVGAALGVTIADACWRDAAGRGFVLSSRARRVLAAVGILRAHQVEALADVDVRELWAQRDCGRVTLVQIVRCGLAYGVHLRHGLNVERYIAGERWHSPSRRRG